MILALPPLCIAPAELLRVQTFIARIIFCFHHSGKNELNSFLSSSLGISSGVKGVAWTVSWGRISSFDLMLDEPQLIWVQATQVD